MTDTQQKPAFDISDRGFNIKAFYQEGSQDAKIEVTRDTNPFRSFEYPAYRIWNLAAHFHDIVDDILSKEEAPTPNSHDN